MKYADVKQRVLLLASRGCTEFETFRALQHLMKYVTGAEYEELLEEFRAEEKRWYERQQTAKETRDREDAAKKSRR